VAEQDAGVAARLLNTGQEGDAAIRLAAPGTITWITVANTTLRNAGVAGCQLTATPASLQRTNAPVS
jgi:hypothetical protein